MVSSLVKTNLNHMKQLFPCALSLVTAFFVLTMTSCGKTTKGKLTNEWKVTSYEEKTTIEFQSGDKSTSTTSCTETDYKNITSQTFDGSPSSYTSIGTVKLHEFSIKKDGTWTLERIIYYGAAEVTAAVKLSGEWAFLGKSKATDFKKNERVVFNVLNETTTSTSGTDSYSGTTSYLSGERALFYTVKESKAKELQLELEYNQVHTDAAGTGTTTSSETMTLKQK